MVVDTETWVVGRWMHIVLFNALRPTTNTTDLFFSTQDRLQWNNNDTQTNYAGSRTLTNIYFCIDGNEIADCAGRQWANAYYKDLRVWNADYMTADSVLTSFQL